MYIDLAYALYYALSRGSKLAVWITMFELTHPLPQPPP